MPKTPSASHLDVVAGANRLQLLLLERPEVARQLVVLHLVDPRRVHLRRACAAGDVAQQPAVIQLAQPRGQLGNQLWLVQRRIHQHAIGLTLLRERCLR